MRPSARSIVRQAALWATIITLTASAAHAIPTWYARRNNLDFFHMPLGYELAYPSSAALAPGMVIAGVTILSVFWMRDASLELRQMWYTSHGRPTLAFVDSYLHAENFSLRWTLPLTWLFYFALAAIVRRLQVLRAQEISA